MKALQNEPCITQKQEGDRMSTNYLPFDVSVGREKPETILNHDAACPFCNRATLSGIIDQEGELLLIKNKYNVLPDAFQTVLIETADCNRAFAHYDKPHLYALLRFGLKHWLAMSRSHEYKAALFFKNHGPYSGGTMRHPHMQIIGLRNLAALPLAAPQDFTGLCIDRRDGVELNISTYPRIGFSEFNVCAAANAPIEPLADYVQAAVHFLCYHLPHKCSSYNLFFYDLDGCIRVKILPRFATSPLYIGYGIHLVPTNLEETAARVRALYFAK